MTTTERLLLERARHLAWKDLQPLIREGQGDYVDQHFMSVVLDYYTRLLTQQILQNLHRKNHIVPKKSTT
jgi:hypothetical protein